jgi:cytochrome c biogenesis protein CcdA
MNGRRNLTIYLGIGISLFGVVLYDPLGLLFRGMGLAVIALGFVCMFFGYKQLNEVELVNRAVEGFEKK